MNSYFFLFKYLWSRCYIYFKVMTPHIVSIRLKRCNTIFRWCVADGQRDTLLKWPQVDSALDSVRKHHTVADILNL